MRTFVQGGVAKPLRLLSQNTISLACGIRGVTGFSPTAPRELTSAFDLKHSSQAPIAKLPSPTNLVTMGRKNNVKQQEQAKPAPEKKIAAPVPNKRTQPAAKDMQGGKGGGKKGGKK